MYPRPFPYYESINYPFRDNATFYINDTLQFPKEFLVDAHIYTSTNETYEITQIIKESRQIIFIIGSYFNTTEIRGVYDLLKSTKTIELFDNYGRRAGMLVVNDDLTIKALPNGIYDLLTGALQFEISCHIPVDTSAVTGLLINGKLVTGDIQFIGTQGIALVRNGNEITIHFVGEPYYSHWETFKNGREVFNNYLSLVTLTVNNPLHPEYSGQVLLQPDANGNIPIFTNNLLFYEDALRVEGRLNNLDIRLAVNGN